MTEPKKVVVTGAAGYIAGLVLPALRERYRLTLLDVRATDRNSNLLPEIHAADLVDRNRDAYRHHFQGADAVIHFGFVRPDDPNDSDQRFWAEFANVQMAYNVYQTAWEEQVRRVVAASSNHAADYYERLILDHKMDTVYPNGRALSDNYYGWAKEVYEHLGFVFATGRMHGMPLGGPQWHLEESAEPGQRRPLENVQIRIGGPRETDLATIEKGDLKRVRRALAAYISQRDLQQLFVKSIEAPDIRDRHGVPFQIFYGISGNSHGFWSLVNAREVIGYAPEDNSEVRFRELVAEHMAAAIVR